MDNTLSRNEQITSPSSGALIPIAESVGTVQKNVSVENLGMALNRNASEKSEMSNDYYITFTNANGASMKIKYSSFLGVLQTLGIRMYASETSLKNVIPSPQTGLVAFVGTGFPAEIWQCTTSGVWSDTGKQYNPGADLSGYALSSDLAETNAQIVSIKSGMASINTNIAALSMAVSEKQATLKQGDNITLTANDDGTVTISSTASGNVKGVIVNGKTYDTVNENGLIDIGIISGTDGVKKVKVNEKEYSPDAEGVVDLGTIEGGGSLTDGCVKTAHISDNAVTQAKLSEDVVNLINSKFSYQRVTTDNHLQSFASKSDADKYDSDTTTYASLLLGDVVLPSGGGTTGITYYIRCVNNLSSLNLSVAKDDGCDLDFTFISKYKYADDTEYTNTDENGRVEIYVKNSKYTDFTLQSTLEMQSNTEKVYKVKDFLENGTNLVKILITGLNTNQTTAAVIYTVQVTSMSLTAPNFAWNAPFTGDINIPFYISGNVSKSLIINVTGNNYVKAYTYDIGTSVYTDTIYPGALVSFPDAEGVYSISAYLQNADGSVKTKALAWNVIFITSGSQKKYMAVNSILDKPKNWSDNILFAYTIYDKGASATDAKFVVKKGDTVLYSSSETSIETGVKQLFAYNMELDIADLSFQITVDVLNSDSSSLVTQMTYTVDNSAGYSATPDDVFYLNPRTRSNTQSNKTAVINAVDASELAAVWSGMSWANDGWTSDKDNNRLLRLIAGSSVDIPFQPFASERALSGITLEFDYKVSNVTDYSKPILTIAKDSTDGKFVGLKIYPDNVFPCSSSLSSDDNQGMPTNDETRIRVTVVLTPNAYGNSGYNLCMTFIDGKRNRVFAYQSNDYWQAISDIIIGNDYADIDIYGIRIYYASLTSSSVLKNFVNWQPSTDEKAATVERNAVYDTDGTTLSFAEIKKRKNVFTFSSPFPNKFNPTSVTGDLEFFFLNETETRKNFKITNVTCSGQGTSSKKYPEWNEKFAVGTSSVITYSDGTTGSKRVLMFDGVPKCAKFTGKKNWASSMQDHKAGSVNAYTDLWKAMGFSNPASEVDSEVRVSVYQEPFIGFYKYLSDDGVNYIYKCMGEFTVGPDKGDKYCFGYDSAAATKLISIEGSDNSPLHALFRLPWNEDVIYSSDNEAWQYNGVNAWDFDGGKTDNIDDFITAYNMVYNTSRMIRPFNGTLDELTAAKETYSATGYQYWIAKEGDPNQYNLYFYDAKSDSFRFSVNLKTQLVGQTFSYKDVDITNTVSLTDADLTGAADSEAINGLFKAARLAMFGQNIGNHFDVDDSLYHDCFTFVIAGNDNRAKNTYIYKMIVGGLFKWRGDDFDTILPVDNEGKLRKPYWVEIHDLDSSNNNYWNGETSVFHNNLEDAFPNRMKKMMGDMLDTMRSLGGLTSGTYREQIYAFYAKYYLGVKTYFPEAIINEDQKRYDNAKLVDASPVVDPLSQSLGDLYSCETAWMKRRIEYVCSKFSYGEYSSHGTDVISFRASGTMNFQLIPALKMYPTIENGTSIVRGARTEAGDICSITFKIEGGDQPVSIEGASYLMSVGDLHDKLIFGDMSVSARMLKELVLGNNDKSAVKIAITSLSLANCPALQVLNITNVSTFTNTTLDVTACSHLKQLYAGGTNFTQIALPTGTALSYVSYPSTNKYLILKSMPVLSLDGLVISGCSVNIIDLFVKDCPNINPFTLLLNIMGAQSAQTAHTLLHIRISGFDVTYSDNSSANNVMKKLLSLTDGSYSGLSADGIANSALYPKPILEGSITLKTNLYRYVYEGLTSYFGSTLAISINGHFYVKFIDAGAEKSAAAVWGDGTGAYEELVSAVTEIAAQFQNNTDMVDFSDFATLFTKVTKIDAGAFSGCTKLASMTVPDTVTEILDGAFAGTQIATLNAAGATKAYLNNMTKLTSFLKNAGTTEMSLENDALVTGDFDASSMAAIVYLNLKGTGITGVKAFGNASLVHLYIPSSATSLMIKNAAALTDLSYSDAAAGIINLLVMGCAGVNSFDIFYAVYIAQSSQTAHALKHVRIDGVDKTYSDATEANTVLNNLMAIKNAGDYYALTADGASDETAAPSLTGTLNINANSYQDVVDNLSAYFSTLNINVTGKVYIRFEDSAVEAICASNWGDGTGITKEQCAAVSSIGTVFSGNTEITKFSEFKYFSNSKLGRSFYGCSNLQKIDLSNCTYIGAECFGNCTSLSDIVSMEKVTYIGDYETFSNTKSLCIDLNLPNLESFAGSFTGSGITNIISLGKITSIYWTGIFGNTCPNLKTAILPSTLIEIGSNLFAYNTNMEWVKVMAEKAPLLDNSDAFISSGIQYPIYVPDASLNSYKSATNWSRYASRIKPLSEFSTDFPNG